jgi:predicted amino acid-binding ACT domain protein
MAFSSTLTLGCPDRPGIVYRVCEFLYARGANIVDSAQFDDKHSNRFFMRVQFEVAAADARLAGLEAEFAPLAAEFGMQARFHDEARRTRTVIMVSQHGHCLNDLLFRWQTGALPIDIAAIVSNHRDFYRLAASHDIPFHHVPVTRETKPAAERKLLELVEEQDVDLVVLARYMQILSPELCARLEGPGDQHPPLVPAELQGGATLLPGLRPRRETDRRHRALRDHRPGRGADHRAGHRPGGSPHGPGRAGGRGPRRRVDGAGPRRGLARAAPGDPERLEDGRVPLDARSGCGVGPARRRWSGPMHR